MNCCDEYGNCRQGRDCPVRVESGDELSDMFVWAITLFAVVGLVSFVGGLLIGWFG